MRKLSTKQVAESLQLQFKNEIVLIEHEFGSVNVEPSQFLIFGNEEEIYNYMKKQYNVDHKGIRDIKRWNHETGDDYVWSEHADYILTDSNNEEFLPDYYTKDITLVDLEGTRNSINFIMYKSEGYSLNFVNNTSLHEKIIGKLKLKLA
jgi:hypothetical protein